MNFQEVVDRFGGEIALAKALGITPQAVYLWKKKIPKFRQLQIERLTNGDLTANVFSSTGKAA